MKPKWSWTTVETAQVSPFWAIDPTQTIVPTFLSVKFKQLSSLHALHLPTPPDAPFPIDSIVTMDASINRLQSLDGLGGICPNLRELQLRTITGLDMLVQLRVLLAANNYLTTLTWLWPGNRLVHVDISSNGLVSLAGLHLCPTLRKLNVAENQLTSLAGLQHALQLEELECRHNQLTDDTLGYLCPLTKLRVLSVGFNRLADVDALAKVVFALSRLEEVNCVENPVTKCEVYRFRMCQNRTLRVLDHKQVSQALRTSMDSMGTDQAVTALVERTTLGYLEHMETQKRVLDEGMHFYKAREELLTQAFDQYKCTMESEMDECVQFAHRLTTSDRTSYLLSKTGLDEWKQALQRMAQERTDAEDAKAQADKATTEQTMRVRAATLSYEKKLLDLAAHRPHVWRDIKIMELNQRQMEDARRDERDKLRRLQDDEKERRVVLERERRARAVLELVKTMHIDEVPEMSDKIDRLRAKSVRLKTKERAAKRIQQAFRHRKEQHTTVEKKMEKQPTQPQVQVAAVVVEAVTKETKKKGFSLWRKKK
ncbi:Aste57867_22353 [Aphanomyces stellatus]|uniref:Aste57867_22353 protein n=1 Tax=Aphanomyces stellatus TaxID=120398 RepID=A0A485LK49_9STRA|nr:hypothetical protein As57867_022283 [Aphanomyces stellatus]VFT99016.1 Aste57867_22353 [Aphanomyces stellatus]